MSTSSCLSRLFAASALVAVAAPGALYAQSNSGSIQGTVTDSTGAMLPGASVTLGNPVSGYSRSVVTDSTGRYAFTNLPFNPYHLVISASGFAAVSQDADVRSTVPVAIATRLQPEGGSTTVTVEGGGDLV
jgi:hypothetical protein